MPKKESKQIYVRPEDKRRLEALAQRERRGIANQFSLILDEACERRGLGRDALLTESISTTRARRTG